MIRHVRLYVFDSAYGIGWYQTCQGCYERELAAARKEAKLMGFRTTMKPWAKLKAKETFCEVR